MSKENGQVGLRGTVRLCVCARALRSCARALRACARVQFWGRTTWVNNQTSPIWRVGAPSYYNSVIKEVEPYCVVKG